MERKKVGIVGGGAAGMMAAITAARAEAKVTILESGERIGKKILSTGKGKCNLGNLEMNRQQYYGGCGDRYGGLPECTGMCGRRGPSESDGPDGIRSLSRTVFRR